MAMTNLNMLPNKSGQNAFIDMMLDVNSINRGSLIDWF
jgi:hypothetical protein